MSGVNFDRESAQRIGKAVQRVENYPDAGIAPYRRKNRAASGRASAANPLADSQFYATLKSATTDTVAINAGRLIRGTTVTSIGAAEVAISPSGTATYYVYLESYYYGGAAQGYASSTTYPTQAVKTISTFDLPCERILIATVTVVDGAITTVKPEQIGEIHSTRLW